MNEETTNNQVISAFYTSWSIYARNFNVWQLDWAKVTHLNYAFAQIKDNRIELIDPWADKDKRFLERGDKENDPNNWLFGNLNQIFKLKKLNRHVKTGIAVGGWNNSSGFSSMVKSKDSRSIFIDSCLKFMRDYGMDYINLDWEYPVTGGSPENPNSPLDGANYLLLVKELNLKLQEFNKANLANHFITLNVAAAPDLARNVPLAEMSQFVEYFNVMAFDFSGSWSTVTGHASNLSGGSLNVAKCIQYYLTMMPSNKIVLGVPFYGRGFENVNSVVPGEKFVGVGPGSYEPGVYDYKAIPMNDRYWHESFKSSIHYASKRWITFESTRSLKHKLDYCKLKQLRGLMFWEVSSDLPTTDLKSLHLVIYQGLVDNLDHSLNMISYPDSIFPNVSSST